MLHIEYNEALNPYGGTMFELVPQSRRKIEHMKKVLKDDFMVENPMRTFAGRIIGGWYSEMDEDEVSQYEEYAEMIAECFLLDEEKGQESSMNVLMLLSRLMQLYVAEKSKNSSSENERDS